MSTRSALIALYAISLLAVGYRAIPLFRSHSPGMALATVLLWPVVFVVEGAWVLISKFREPEPVRTVTNDWEDDEP